MPCVKLRVATWNLDYWKNRNKLEDVWAFYLDEVDADIFFFQEGRPLEGMKASGDLVWSEIGGNRDWGSGIFSEKCELVEEKLNPGLWDHPEGILAIANTTVGEKELTLVSLYGILEEVGHTKYSITTLHRIFSDLTGILNGHVGGQREVVLGGDFNASEQFDPNQPGESHRILFERVKDFGLTNCFDSFYDEYVQTLRHPKSDVPWQNDYFFVSDSLSQGLKGCEVLDNEKVRKYSDHNPTVISLEI